MVQTPNSRKEEGKMMIKDGQLKFAGYTLDYPAVELSIGGRILPWEPCGKGVFRSGGITMRVRYTRIEKGFRKELEITSDSPMPTPDYLIVDRQRIVDPGLRMRGYVASAEQCSMELSDEEGGGVMPGCGYPLIGNNIFTALEHQAGFNIIRERSKENVLYELRQHPVWENGRLCTMSAVFVVSEDPEQAFRSYLEKIRLPGADRSLFSFCSFWSEPYTGNYEYVIGGDNYRSFVEAFSRLDLHPDVYTLDAGWQDRRSIFQAKEAVGGDKGLVRLRKFLEKNGAALSLWVSHNGPMGIDPEYLASIGIATGRGISSTYRGDGFGVLLDKKLEQVLTERFSALCGKEIGAVHLKMDWDNDCASAPRFKEKYPTRNHVREASVNVQNRIAHAIRRVNPDVRLRHGWWPSPWQLCYAEHLFLADSGDCEYTSLPSLNQRDASFTARDIQYYHHFRRDGNMVPLNAIDNHDFPQAPRNPFAGNDGVWSNAAIWAVMRGTGYQPWKLQPEALTDTQCDILRRVMSFARRNEKLLFGSTGAMIGGNPRRGEIYGFYHRHGATEIWAYRNPLPIPQEFSDLPGCSGHEELYQIYPDCRCVKEKLLFAPHEVKIIQKSRHSTKFPVYPFQRRDGRIFFPASAVVSKEISPMVAEVYQVPEFKIIEAMDQQIPGGKRYWFKLRAPYRMNECALLFRLKGNSCGNVTPKLYISRAERSTGNCFPVPYSEIFPGNPGRGEFRNPEERPFFGRIFQAPLPCGGNICCRLELHGPACELELWAYGSESASRADAPAPRMKGILEIPGSALGFICCVPMEVTGSEPPAEE